MPETSDTSPSPKQLLAGRGLRPRKRFGQNFLVDARLAQRVASAIPQDAYIIEIGGGTGTLTRALASRARALVVLEIDRDLAGILRERFDEDRRTIEILTIDALDFDFSAALAAAKAPRAICGNLPYNITTPLIERIVGVAPLWETAVLMVQREYARRLAAKPGTPEYGSLTLFVGYYCEVRKLIDVGAAGFYPAPAVDSTVIQLTPQTDRSRGVRDERLMLRLIRAAFAQRRKTLSNCVAARSPGVSRAAIDAAIRAASVDPSVRGERLSLEDYRRLSNSLADADIDMV
jgi:16S rRNA (adenine1518-N6/adenine1519-N6)-dimethyltransferase